MCKALSFELDFEQDQQVDQHAEIVALNNWNPQQIKRTQRKSGQNDGEGLFKKIKFVIFL